LRIHSVDPQALLAVWLFNYAVDVERAEDCRGAFVIHNDNTIAAWRDECMIDRGN
jgi:hypothetical protein